MNIQNLAGNAYIQDWLKGKFEARVRRERRQPEPVRDVRPLLRARARTSASRPATRSAALAEARREERLGRPRPPARRPRSRRVNHYLTANAVWLWLFDSYDYAAVASNVHGFTLPPTRTSTPSHTRRVS